MTHTLIQKLPYLGGVVLLSVASTAVARATTIDFDYTGSIVSFTVPVTGVYDIDTFGGQGGVNTGAVVKSAGLGAEAGGQFSLTAGETLSILVGGRGGGGSGLDGGGGGGGGSFVALAKMPSVGPACPGASSLFTCPDTLLAAAGGGGGAGTLKGGDDGQSGRAGTGATILGGVGGFFGLGGGGEGGLNGAGGGGGYLVNALAGEPTGGGGGKSFFNGGGGGAGEVFSIFGFTISAGGNGGFGSGGGGGQGGAGGGGAGFTGGGGGDQGSGGGGAGSFVNDALLVSAIDEVLTGGVHTGNGEVTISFESAAAVPEPWGLLLLGTGLLGFAAFMRNRKPSGPMVRPNAWHPLFFRHAPKAGTQGNKRPRSRL